MKGVRGSESPHGTNARYASGGCRCDDCRRARREYCRAVYGLQPRAEWDAEREARHGTESRYVYHRCRCDACRAASALARRQRRYRSRDAARAYDRAYRKRRSAAQRRATHERAAAPDFPDPPYGNIYAQELADTREAERLRRERRATANAELEPRFLVTVTLDGDEWPPTATEQAERELRRALDTIDLRGGVIRAYTIERAP